jgi:hypothetical protein
LAAAEDSSRRQEIQSSLKSIVENSEKWLERLRKRQLRVRIASSFLTTILAFLAVVVAGVISLFVEGKLFFLIRNPTPLFPLFGIAALAGFASGFLTYFIMRGGHKMEIKELSSLITQMKSAEEGGQVAVAGEALSLADKVFVLLPEIARKRNQDPILFGLAAFILALFAGNPGIAVLVGIIVWIYFRYETRKTYEEEVSKFEEQKKAFEQRKKDFIETL